MDLSKIGDNILKVFQVLLTIVGVIGAFFLSLFIITLVMGIIYNLVTGGTISVDSATNTTMSMLSGNFSSMVGSLVTAAGTTGSLIIVAAVIIVFGGLVVLGYKGYKSYKNRNQGMGGY